MLSNFTQTFKKLRGFLSPLGASAPKRIYGDLSPTSLAPEGETSTQMKKDRILNCSFFTSLSHEEKEEVKKAIAFVYGFMGRHGWIKIDNPQGIGMSFLELPRPTQEERIALVESMTQTVNGRRKRLLQLAGSQRDNDLLQQEGNESLIENYLLTLIRFFGKKESFGFHHNMNDIVWAFCVQESENCFLLSACEFVDLQIQKDLQLPESEKRKRFDKSQVARRVMSSKDLVKYVVEDKGNDGLAVVKTLVGKNEEKKLHTYLNDTFSFDSGTGIDYIIGRRWKQAQPGPGLLSFDASGLESSVSPYNVPSIPCFDAFDKKPVGWLKLEKPALNEGTLLEKQRLKNMNPDPRRVNPLGTAQVFPGSPAASPVPSLGSMTSSNSSSFSFMGDEREYTPFNCGMPVAGTSKNPHGGVLLGGITDTNGKQWYLVQNSWKEMPLFLASGNCLAKANANLAVFKSPLRQIPNDGYERTEKRFTTCASPSVNSEGDWNVGVNSLHDEFFMGQRTV